MPPNEIQQVIAQLKKEIAELEIEIKKAENEDQESVAFMKTQLNNYKTLLANFEKQKPVTTKSPSQATIKKDIIQTPSPLVPVRLKQPITPPTAAQAKDRFFWYKGKKINDSTLVTVKGTIIQYSYKRQQLIVQQEEKKDSFTVRVKEIMRGEQRKRELVDQFDKLKNGFIYYPFINTSLSIYDDLTRRFSNAVKNTISFDQTSPGFIFQNNSLLPSNIAKGPNALTWNDNTEDYSEDELEWVLQQLDEAQKKCMQLPSTDAFPPPPLHELGRCATCDISVINRQRELDEKWLEDYKGKEAAIMQQVLSAMRVHAFIPGEPSADLVNAKFQIVVNLLMKRISDKNRILADRYGNNLQSLSIIFPVILGHERQKQLLGTDEGSSDNLLSLLINKVKNAYWKYYNEQVAAKNHDFVLNIPFHLGYFRQLALLGSDDPQAGNVADFMNRTLAYNRFSLTMDLDFIWERTADGELQMRATGKMGSKEKVYVMLYPDSCSFRLMGYKTDLSNKTLEDITLPLHVSAGIKTIKEDNDKLVNYPYEGPAEYAFRFPDARIEFCSSAPDTMFLTAIGGNEEVAARAGNDIEKISKSYTIDILIYANQALLNEDASSMEQEIQDAGTGILSNISGFMQQSVPATTLEKIKTQYEGYMSMDNLRQRFEKAYTTSKSYILFNANNRTTVLTDTYLDTRRRITDDMEIKKGLFHLRMVHEPVK
jgi:hypothetical protein